MYTKKTCLKVYTDNCILEILDVLNQITVLIRNTITAVFIPCSLQTRLSCINKESHSEKFLNLSGVNVQIRHFITFCVHVQFTTALTLCKVISAFL